jgi:predicted 3-demethylubiquinone-9 3-methyltransferase (glyoxalase superfamily)
MRDRPIVPCLWLDDQAETAERFYLGVFPNGRHVALSRYPQSGDNPAGKPPGSVLTVELEIAGQRFTALNGGPVFSINPSVSFFVETDEVGDTERLFGALADGGEALMPLGAYPWSERYGWTKDRFGVSWQVMTRRQPAGSIGIAPCLMFAGPQSGRAAEALATYASLLPGGRVELIERYAPHEGPEGAVKHGRCLVAGQSLIAMDSHIDHGITFDEGVSLQLFCDDQAEIDHYWAALSEGGAPGPCGWLKDRFGLSWQIVHRGILAWMASPDADARDRAFHAMMRMQKPDVAALQAAFEGR